MTNWEKAVATAKGASYAFPCIGWLLVAWSLEELIERAPGWLAEADRRADELEAKADAVLGVTSRG